MKIPIYPSASLYIRISLVCCNNRINSIAGEQPALPIVLSAPSFSEVSRPQAVGAVAVLFSQLPRFFYEPSESVTTDCTGDFPTSHCGAAERPCPGDVNEQWPRKTWR